MESSGQPARSWRTPWPADREDSTLVDGAPDCDLLDLTGVDRYRVIVENGKVSKFARLDAADLFFELQRVCRINSNRFERAAATDTLLRRGDCRTLWCD